MTSITEDVENLEEVREQDTIKRETQTMTTHLHQTEITMKGAKNEFKAHKEL